MSDVSLGPQFGDLVKQYKRKLSKHHDAPSAMFCYRSAECRMQHPGCSIGCSIWLPPHRGSAGSRHAGLGRNRGAAVGALRYLGVACTLAQEVRCRFGG